MIRSVPPLVTAGVVVVEVVVVEVVEVVEEVEVVEVVVVVEVLVVEVVEVVEEVAVVEFPQLLRTSEKINTIPRTTNNSFFIFKIDPLL